MTDVSTSHDQRRTPRFPVLNHQACRVQIERGGDGTAVEIIEGELIDLSQGGAKLRLAAFLQFAETVRVRISIAELDLAINVTSDVCWTRRDDVNAWLVGCAFSPPISDETLQALAVHSLIERRQAPRSSVTTEAILSLQNSDQQLRVRLRDISAGGFCLVTSVAIPVGDKLQLAMTNSDGSDLTITGKVRWSMQSDNEYLVGCMAVPTAAYHRFRATISEPSANIRAAAMRPKYQRWIAVGLVIVVTASLAGTLILQSISSRGGAPSRVAIELDKSPSTLASSAPSPAPILPDSAHYPSNRPSAEDVGAHRDHPKAQRSAHVSVPYAEPQIDALKPTTQLSRQIRKQPPADTARQPSSDPLPTTATLPAHKEVRSPSPPNPVLVQESTRAIKSGQPSLRRKTREPLPAEELSVTPSKSPTRGDRPLERRPTTLSNRVPTPESNTHGAEHRSPRRASDNRGPSPSTERSFETITTSDNHNAPLVIETHAHALPTSTESLAAKLSTRFGWENKLIA